jgi:hypothetical protein
LTLIPGLPYPEGALILPEMVTLTNEFESWIVVVALKFGSVRTIDELADLN